VKFIVNGREHEWTNPSKRIGYGFLCRMAGRYPEHRPTVTYRMPNGIANEVFPEQFAPIAEGIIFNVAHTGNA
jgi:hypothetical protein